MTIDGLAVLIAIAVGIIIAVIFYRIGVIVEHDRSITRRRSLCRQYRRIVNRLLEVDMTRF